MSPLYGKVDRLRLLEWRIHHAKLGIKVVHWYVRPEMAFLRPLVEHWNKAIALHDTWTLAPYLADMEAEGTRRLHSRGAYADQVGVKAIWLEKGSSQHQHTRWCSSSCT